MDLLFLTLLVGGFAFCIWLLGRKRGEERSR